MLLCLCFSEPVERYYLLIARLFFSGGYRPFGCLRTAFVMCNVPYIKFHTGSRREYRRNIIAVEETFFRSVARSETERGNHAAILCPLEVLVVLPVEYEDETFSFFFFRKSSVAHNCLIRKFHDHINLAIIVQQVVKQVLKVFDLLLHPNILYHARQN
jgi:hypothetical protein